MSDTTKGQIEALNKLLVDAGIKLENTGSKLYMLTQKELLRLVNQATHDALERAAVACESGGVDRKSVLIDGTAFYIALGQAAQVIRAIKGTP